MKKEHYCMPRPLSIVQAVKKISPAVISISISRNFIDDNSMYSAPAGVDSFDDILSPFVPPGYQSDGATPRKVRVGGGSGFFVSPDGIILTNKHVVYDDEATYDVVTSDEQTLQASILAKDPLNDIAILKVKDEHFPIVPLGNSNELELGQSVITIGNALGEFQNTVSHGIISGLSRFLSPEAAGEVAEQLRGVIQTDASINPGNSGGPLVNLFGEAVGINAAVIYGAENIGFAIPINAAKRDLVDIARHGHLRTPYLGIRYLLLTSELAVRNNLPVDHGALVIREGMPGDMAVMPGSPAAQAGIQEFDIMLECNEKPIDTKNTIVDYLRKSSVGDTLTFKILRDNREFIKKVRLQERTLPSRIHHE